MTPTLGRLRKRLLGFLVVPAAQTGERRGRELHFGESHLGPLGHKPRKPP